MIFLCFNCFIFKFWSRKCITVPLCCKFYFHFPDPYQQKSTVYHLNSYVIQGPQVLSLHNMPPDDNWTEMRDRDVFVYFLNMVRNNASNYEV